MRKSFLIYEETRKYFPIYEEVVSHIWLCNFSILNFLIYEENFIFFFISVLFIIQTPLTGSIVYKHNLSCTDLWLLLFLLYLPSTYLLTGPLQQVFYPVPMCLWLQVQYKQTMFLNFIGICLFISLFSSYLLSLTYMLGFIWNKKNWSIHCKSTLKYGNCSLT